MLFDTDVLIWYLRGNTKAARRIDEAPDRHLSVVSYMELLQGARSRREVKVLKSFLVDVGLRLLPLSEDIGHRGSIYMEEYCLKVAMGMGDVLIAATAVENQLVLCTANDKHYKPISELEIRRFRP